jgi:broad specificity phosphatase PhoE
MGLIEQNAALEAEMRELNETVNEIGARANELKSKLAAEIEVTGTLRVQVAAHEATIEALRGELEHERQSAAEHANVTTGRITELETALEGANAKVAKLPSVAAGVAAEMASLGVPPIATAVDVGQQVSWRDRYFAEKDSVKRAAMWAEHSAEIIEGK